MLVIILAALAIWNGPVGNGLPGLLDTDPGKPDPTGQVESQNPVTRLDLALYDFFLRTSALPQDPSIAIVAIDDESIAAIGRWPWRRPIIAELVSRVAVLEPKAVAIDIVFAEEAPDPRDDEILADAFERAEPVLAVAREPFGAHGYLPLYPIAVLARNARLGHVVMTHGADGRVRGLFAYEAWFPALSLALVDPLVHADHAAADAMLTRGEWTAWQPLLPRAFERSPAAISALELLRGNIAPSQIEGRFVLIGTTAVGVGDTFSTPLIIDRNRASGVELHAVAASAIQQQRLIRAIHPWSHALLTVAAIIGLMVVLFRAAPRYSLPICVAAILFVLAITAAAFRFDRWIQPAGLVTAFALAYPLWSWRRLSAASAGLLRHARRLEAMPSVLTPAASVPRSAEPIARELGRLSDAATQVRLLNRFLLDGLESLPHPVLIAAPTGRILFRNQQMIDAFGDAAPAVGGEAGRWFESIFRAPLPVAASTAQPRSHAIELIDDRRRCWLASLNLTSSADAAEPGGAGTTGAGGPRGGNANAGANSNAGANARAGAGRSADEGERGPPSDGHAPSDDDGDRDSDSDSDSDSDGGERLMLQLVDITALRDAEREREEAISFLSHDLRSPQVSILAMTQTDGASSAGGTPIDPVVLRRHARRALELTDEFLAFARAGSKPIEREPYDLVDLATEVVDLSWDRAHKAGVRLVQPDTVDSALVSCDAGMIRRAVLNLIENAIRHGGADSTVTVRVVDRGDDWGLEIEDEGPGIAPEFLATIFQAWAQADGQGGRPSGHRGSAGLGLAMVQRTVSRHGGSVSARNRTDRPGAAFEIRLPKAPAGIIFDHGTADDRTEPRDGPTGHP